MNEEEKKEIVQKLRFEWEKEGGFFFDFRDSVLNVEAATRAYDLIQGIDLYQEKIDREIVSLLWDIPNFLEGSYEHVVDSGASFEEVREWVDKFMLLVTDKFEKPL